MAQGRFALERLSRDHLELAFPWLRGLMIDVMDDRTFSEILHLWYSFLNVPLLHRAWHFTEIQKFLGCSLGTI